MLLRGRVFLFVVFVCVAVCCLRVRWTVCGFVVCLGVLCGVCLLVGTVVNGWCLCTSLGCCFGVVGFACAVVGGWICDFASYLWV